MVDFYCDISAVGNEYQAYADTPTTWGVPQDGNGKAGPGHAASVAIGTIDCASASASGAGVLGVLGVTVSSTLTGSGATLATNIVTAINAASTAVIATYSALLLPLNKLVYARVNPVTSTEVQIMLRIAGTDWNGFTPTTAGTWGAVPTMGMFAGGSNGPWAYAFSTVAVFGKAVQTYGFLANKPAGVSVNSAEDTIYYRSARSGSPLSVSYSASSGVGFNTLWLNAIVVIDNLGQIWTGDTGVVVWSLTKTGAVASIPFAYSPTPGVTKLKIAATTIYGLRIVITSAAAQTANYLSSVFVGSSGYVSAKNVAFEAGSAYTYFSVGYIGNLGGKLILDSCYILQKSNIGAIYHGSFTCDIRLIACKLEWAGIGANVLSVFGSNLASSSYRYSVSGCTFVVDSGAFTVNGLISGSSGNIYTVLTASAVNNYGLLTTSIGITPNNLASNSAYWRDFKDGSFRYEKGSHTIDYLPTAGYPTLSAIGVSGQLISYRVSWEAARLELVIGPVEVLRGSVVNATGAAIKTIRYEALVPTAEIPNTYQIGLIVTYKSVAGVTVTELSQTPKISALPHVASYVTWSGAAIDQSPVAFKLTTAQAVASDSEITASIVFYAPPSGTYSLFINPEVMLS